MCSESLFFAFLGTLLCLRASLPLILGFLPFCWITSISSNINAPLLPCRPHAAHLPRSFHGAPSLWVSFLFSGCSPVVLQPLLFHQPFPLRGWRTPWSQTPPPSPQVSPRSCRCTRPRAGSRASRSVSSIHPKLFPEIRSSSPVLLLSKWTPSYWATSLRRRSPSWN